MFTRWFHMYQSVAIKKLNVHDRVNTIHAHLLRFIYFRYFDISRYQ